jgi:hypothetical protein
LINMELGSSVHLIVIWVTEFLKLIEVVSSKSFSVMIYP